MGAEENEATLRLTMIPGSGQAIKIICSLCDRHCISMDIKQKRSYLCYEGVHVWSSEDCVLSESPKGFQVAGSGVRVSEPVAWAGGAHEAGSETISYDLSWFWPAECEEIR